MSTNFVRNGETIPYANSTGSPITSNTAVALGTILGVAQTDIPDGEVGALNTKGVFYLPKTSSATINAGDSLIWDASAQELTNSVTLATGDITGAATAWSDAGNGDTTVLASINFNNATVT